MSVLRTVVAGLAGSRRTGIVLTVLAAVAGLVLYVAAPGSPPVSADADAVTMPPLVRAEPMESPPPNVVRVASQALTKPLAAPTLPPDRTSLVRELQKALARADCYNGPINGVWGEASKDAMRGFVVAVNAQLPVDNPDEALVALVESNDTATCPRGRAIYTGALNSPAPLPSDDQGHPAPQAETLASQPAPSSLPTPAAADNHSMIDQPWAAPEMLVPPKDMASNAAQAPTQAPAPAPTPPSLRVVAVTVDTAEPIPHPEDPPRAPAAHFEDDKAVATAPSISVQPDTPAASSLPPKTAQKKTKSAKHKSAKEEDVQTSISKSFYSIQKSLSSMFE